MHSKECGTYKWLHQRLLMALVQLKQEFLVWFFFNNKDVYFSNVKILFLI